jgi:hypothetical protein
VFVGSHTALDALYDVFNLYYDEVRGSQETTLSYAGSSFSVPVDPTFRCVIVLDDAMIDEDSEYRRVSLLFLNRFEKLAFRYRDALPTKWAKVPQVMQEKCYVVFGYRQSPKIVTPIPDVYPELLLLNHFSDYDFVVRSHISDNHNISKIRDYFLSLATV